MPLPQRWHKKKQPPAGFEVIEPTLEALEHELRDKIKDTNEKKRKTESMWPVYQINWQKSRYVYDMYYTYHRISKQVYHYCIQQKLIDAALIAKVSSSSSLLLLLFCHIVVFSVVFIRLILDIWILFPLTLLILFFLPLFYYSVEKTRLWTTL